MTSLFAHRGHHVDWPENSVAAVIAARDIGADGVEIDVWLTSDNYLVVTHDRTLGRYPVAASTFNQLQGVSAVVTLGKVLEVTATMRVNVEIKSTRSLAYNLRVARAVSEYLDSSTVSSRCLVSSFSLEICDEVRRASPQRPVGWLVLRRRARLVLDQVARSQLTSAHFPFSRVNESVIARARELGVELHVWTPNLRRDIGRMLDLEVGAVITDDVPLAMELRERHDRATHE